MGEFVIRTRSTYAHMRRGEKEKLWKMKRCKTWSTHGNDCLTCVDWVTNRYKLNAEFLSHKYVVAFRYRGFFFLYARNKLLSELFMKQSGQHGSEKNKRKSKSLNKYVKLISRLLFALNRWIFLCENIFLFGFMWVGCNGNICSYDGNPLGIRRIGCHVPIYLYDISFCNAFSETICSNLQVSFVNHTNNILWLRGEPFYMENFVKMVKTRV